MYNIIIIFEYLSHFSISIAKIFLNLRQAKGYLCTLSCRSLEPEGLSISEHVDSIHLTIRLSILRTKPRSRTTLKATVTFASRRFAASQSASQPDTGFSVHVRRSVRHGKRCTASRWRRNIYTETEKERMKKKTRVSEREPKYLLLDATRESVELRSRPRDPFSTVLSSSSSCVMLVQY